jgi:hypothetical protein
MDARLRACSLQPLQANDVIALILSETFECRWLAFREMPSSEK